jgi:formylglycine-generating enzyme required for sulfatase activity
LPKLKIARATNAIIPSFAFAGGNMTALVPTFLLVIAASTAVAGSAEDAANRVQSEQQILPDGNILDAAPSPKRIADLVSKTRANLIAFDAGTFEMGDWGPEVNKGGLPFDGDFDSKPLHKVRLNAFAIGRFPVTYADFDVFTAALRFPRVNQSSRMQKYRKYNNPVGVTWQGAYDYCQWLGKVAGLSFALPSEAQWEYAARSGGRRARYPTDNGELEEGRNLPDYEQRMSAGGLVPVDGFPPNLAGIYYMSAGVVEWTNDWYDKDYYEHSPAENPRGPSGGAARVTRGFAGSMGSAMTFKRWKYVEEELTGTWTAYSHERGKANRDIPYTKYSAIAEPVFRCVLN